MKPKISLSINNIMEFDMYIELLRKTYPQGAPFVEILWDNYCHIDPLYIRDLLQSLSPNISMHIMWSRFLERSEDDLNDYLRHLRTHVHIIQPKRISDHVATFRKDNLNICIPMEHTYDLTEEICERVHLYQDQIEMQLLLENFASTEHYGNKQITFFKDIINETKCGLLFDVSNAVAAEKNGIAPVDSWISELSDHIAHCHIGGYAYNENTQLFHDTHNQDISVDSFEAWKKVATATSPLSLCYERDYHKSASILANDIAPLMALSENAFRGAA